MAAEAWRIHKESAEMPWLVRPSAPVLFFGDLTAYRASPLRVATVGLNPSKREFPGASPFSRFPGAQSGSIPAYLKSLEAYFRTDPYRTWFNSYEQALLGLGASFYGRKPSTALHTDICSVLPTDPTWGGLDRDVQQQMAATGVLMWQRLISYLRPHVILWSTAGSWLAQNDLAPRSSWKDVLKFRWTENGAPRKQPVVVRACWYHLPKHESVLIAFVPAAQTPLAMLSHPQKLKAGKAIRSFWAKGIRHS
jgi:hypothetical protein